MFRISSAISLGSSPFSCDAAGLTPSASQKPSPSPQPHRAIQESCCTLQPSLSLLPCAMSRPQQQSLSQPVSCPAQIMPGLQPYLPGIMPSLSLQGSTKPEVASFPPGLRPTTQHPADELLSQQSNQNFPPQSPPRSLHDLGSNCDAREAAVHGRASAQMVAAHPGGIAFTPDAGCGLPHQLSPIMQPSYTAPVAALPIDTLPALCAATVVSASAAASAEVATSTPSIVPAVVGSKRAPSALEDATPQKRVARDAHALLVGCEADDTSFPLQVKSAKRLASSK